MDPYALRTAARKHVQLILHKEGTPACLPVASTIEHELFISVVEKFNPSADDSSIEAHEDILFFEACLRQLSPRPTASSLRQLQQWVANTILPDKAFAEKAPFPTSDDPEPSPAQLRRLQAMYFAGLRLLFHLTGPVALLNEDPSAALLTSLASFKDPRDPWTSQEASTEAHALLEHYLDGTKGVPKKLDALLTALLREKVKPLFAKSKSKEITEQGRKAISAVPCPFVSSDLEATIKPWKHQDVYIVTVLKWILGQLTAAQTEANWPLIIPPLLALLDDSATSYKIKGCEVLIKFLKVAPPQVIERTGLGAVFQNALMPCLLYLPSLTPEEESLQLLSAVYPSLIALVNSRFAGEPSRATRMKSFDQIFRKGVLKGYAHAGEHARIAELLIRSATDLVNEMGTASVKHLKPILALLSGILRAPFGLAYPPLLQAAIQAMNAIMVTDWPRVAHHRGDFLEGLIACWCYLQEEELLSADLKELSNSVQKTMRLLTTISKKSVDVVVEYQVLIDSDSRLRDLLVT